MDKINNIKKEVLSYSKYSAIAAMVGVTGLLMIKSISNFIILFM